MQQKCKPERGAGSKETVFFCPKVILRVSNEFLQALAEKEGVVCGGFVVERSRECVHILNMKYCISLRSWIAYIIKSKRRAFYTRLPP